MELQALLVKGAGLDHFVPVLVADAVVDADQVGGRRLDGARGGGGGAEPGQERPRVRLAGDERVRRVAVGADHGRPDRAVLLVVVLGGLLHRLGLAGEGPAVDGVHVVHLERDVLDGVAVPLEVGVHLFEEQGLVGCYRLVLGQMPVRTDGGCEDETDTAVLHNIRGKVSTACLQASVGDRREAEKGIVVCCRLLGISYPPGDVIVTLKLGDTGLNSKAVDLAVVAIGLSCLEEGIFPRRGCRDS